MSRKRNKPTMRTTHRRFFAFWRTLVLLAAVLMVGLSALYLHGPDEVRKFFYPLKYEDQIYEAASEYTVSPYLVAAVIECESGWDANAMSSSGAVGLMQLLPDTAEHVVELGLVDAQEYPAQDLSDPAVNINYGTAYLRYLIDHYSEVEHAIAAYNAGIGNVDIWAANGSDIRDEVQYPETAHYLLQVVRTKEAYEELYPEAFEGWVGSSQGEEGSQDAA